ncbi:hypothetical protein, partial [Priestia flexa]|uniref:hypothetical protein n=1 Tax=Priestia flexa TaxID=86664 RepID=UPI001C6FC8F0
EKRIRVCVHGGECTKVHRLQRKMCIDQSNRSIKKGSHHQNAMMRTLFHYFWLVMSQPLSV